MAVVIKTLRKSKVVAKKFIKELKKIIKYNPDLRIGMYWDESLSFIYDQLLLQKKIKWENVRFFNLVEYKEEQNDSFEKRLYDNFLSKLKNFNKNNLEGLSDRIANLTKENKIDDLYSVNEGIDLLIFSIDKRGNYLFNDFESKIAFINSSSNGNEILSPGIKSIVKAEQIFCFALEDECDNIVSDINSKKITSSQNHSLLNIHENITLFTTYDIIKKKEINKSYYVIDDESLIEKVNAKEKDFSNSLESKEQIIEEKPDQEILSEKKVEDDLNIDDSNEEDKKEVDLESNSDKSNLNDELNDAIAKEEVEENDLVEDEVNESHPELLFTNDDFDVKDEKITNIHDREVESALFKSNELDEIISNKIKVMDDLKNSEIQLKNDEINSKIESLENVKEELEKELAVLENDIVVSDNRESEEKKYVEINGKLYEYTEINEDNEPTPNLDNYKLPHYVRQENSDLTITNKEHDNLKNYLNISNQTIDVDSNSIEELENIIKIKEETLKVIDLLIKNNKLSMEKQAIKLQNNDTSSDINEQSNDLITLTYIPGMRPTPLLMYETYPNNKVYDQMVLDMIEVYKTNMNARIFNYSKTHMWNIGAYLSYDEDTNEIILFAFSDFSNMIYLLRQINKPLKITISKENYKFIIDPLKDLVDEIKVSFS